jgi:hypothetical protein
MLTIRAHIGSLSLLLWLIATSWAPGPAVAQMVSGPKIPGYAETFGLPAAKPAGWSATLVESSAPGNVLWPDESPTFTVQVVNQTGEALDVHAKADVIEYATRGRPNDVWVPDMFKVGLVASEPVDLKVPAKGAKPGWVNVTIAPKVPYKLGAYGLVLDLGENGRQLVTTFVRTFKPEGGRVQYPKFCLDVLPLDVLKRLDVHAVRFGVGYKPTTDPDFDKWFAEQSAQIQRFNDADIAVLFMVGGGTFYGPTQPLGRPRPWLDDQDTMKQTKFDLAWLPSYDADFEKWVRLFAAKFGWPKGPINAFSLWNEPWEGISISGWGADMPRYREIYRHMYDAVDKARAEDGVDLLCGGCDSTMNALDKLFGDGSDEFLPKFDFCSIHYQGLDPGSTIKSWVNRMGPHGRVKIWDTESWVANTDDRVAAVVAANRSAGYDRAMGVFHDNIATENDATIYGDDGKPKRIKVTQTWSVAASIGASQHFIGERNFRELLFKNGLPWVIVMDGLANAEDGTIVVVGDLGEEFGADHLLFRTARGFAERARKGELQKQLAALPPLPADAGKKEKAERAKLVAAATDTETLSGATMTIADAGKFSLYDFYGNPVPAKDGKITVPLDGRGFFLRGDGSAGAYSALIEAVKQSRIEGIEPLAIAAHDMTARIDRHPDLRLTLTNVLNRPVNGLLSLTLGELKLDPPAQTIELAGNETKQVRIKITGGGPKSNNIYPLSLTFEAGADGKQAFEEDMHVNVITKRTIEVDGKLDDWQGIPPQTVVAGDAKPSLTESAWFPFQKFDETVSRGFGSGYLAYDEHFFYFAAKIADDTPDDGMLRFEKRDDDEFYYPPTSYGYDERDKNKPSGGEKRSYTWPDGVRRYSYRKDPELPSGNFPNHDNVQIAFNVLPPDQKPRYINPPGTMPGYIAYPDTDYEYALNPVAEKYGGGTEIWRLRAPGMPDKNFYPRQGASPKDGPVRGGKLVITRDGNTRLVEAAIPWAELPDVKARLDAGEPIKFSFRVNDNGGAGMELSRKRSVAKINPSFHANWIEHWANELEFGFEK